MGVGHHVSWFAETISESKIASVNHELIVTDGQMPTKLIFLMRRNVYFRTTSTEILSPTLWTKGPDNFACTEPLLKRHR